MHCADVERKKGTKFGGKGKRFISEEKKKGGAKEVVRWQGKKTGGKKSTGKRKVNSKESLPKSPREKKEKGREGQHPLLPTR